MGSPKKTISYRYDAVRNRVGMTDPDGGRFTYAYDAVNRISHMVNPQGDRTTDGYDPSGRRPVKRLANGTRAVVHVRRCWESHPVGQSQERWYGDLQL